VAGRVLETVCESNLISVGRRSLRFRIAFAPCYTTDGCYRRYATCGSLKLSDIELISNLAPIYHLMRSRLSQICAYLGMASSLIGCATNPVQRSMLANAAHTWKRAPFVVQFIAGPKGDLDGHSFSYSSYQVSRKFEKYSVPTDLVIQSAMDIHHFQWNSKAQPTDYIKLFTSRSGNTLLIEENIPNDCGPSWNHILVVTAADDMEYEYLDLPSRVTKQTEVFGFTPEVLSISDTQITYRYSDGTTISEDLKQHAKRDKRPNYPG
jgi:hypothetical protein